MTANPELALSLERSLAAPRAAVWRSWTEPELLCQWFCPKPWGEITLTDSPGGGTHYLARALHWSQADMQQHEAMGFHEGWAAATRQLEALAATL